MEPQPSDRYIATISVVVPVYQGEKTITKLVNELADYTKPSVTGSGLKYVVSEVLLVHDFGPDNSAEVIKNLSDQYDWIRPVWLSRNFGQHAATLAGMSSSISEWIVTLDEDGQHDPKNIAKLLDTAIQQNSQLVYGKFDGGAPHSRWRNFFSATAKWLYTKILSPGDGEFFSSFRQSVYNLGRSCGALAKEPCQVATNKWILRRLSLRSF